MTMRAKRLLLNGFDVAARAGRLAERILAPASCAFCGEELQPRAPPVCRACYADMPWVTPAFHLAPFARAVAPLAYAFPIDAAIKRFKFRRKLYYAPAFGCLLDSAADELAGDIDGLLPMPLHWRRQAARGFNQASAISDRLRRTADLPIVKGVRRCRATPYQSGLTARQRKRNVKKAFGVKRRLNFRHILVVDDVITTGETSRELGRMLLDAGVEKVSVIAIARAEAG